MRARGRSERWTLWVGDRDSLDWDPNRDWHRFLAAARFDRVSPLVTPENFPLGRPDDSSSRYKRYRLALVTPGTWMFTRDLMQAIAHNGFELPSFGDALAWAHRHQDVQRSRPIAVFTPSARCEGIDKIPCLYGLNGERAMGLFNEQHNFDACWRFLVRIPKRRQPLVEFVA